MRARGLGTGPVNQGITREVTFWVSDPSEDNQPSRYGVDGCKPVRSLGPGTLLG